MSIVGSRARTLMTMRADIERDGTATTNARGHPDPPVYASHLTGLASRVYSKRRQEVVDGRKEAMVEEIRMIVPVGTDITELDRVANVKDRLGVVIWAGPMNIRAIQHKHTHLEMELQRVQS